MDSLTPTEVWAAILAAASATVLLTNAAKAIASAWQVAKAPSAQQNQRLEALEDWKKEVDKHLNRYRQHLDSIDASNRVTQLALLALLDHGIDGNNIDQMQHAKEELQTHLINR